MRPQVRIKPMAKTNVVVAIPDEVVMNKIYFIRSHKVMLDSDLAELYGVETKRLKETVKRNLSRFPADFMFELNQTELEVLKSQFASLHYHPIKHAFFLRYLSLLPMTLHPLYQ